MAHSSHNAGRVVWRWIFGFLAALLTALTATVCILTATLCSEDFLLRQMDASDYYHNAAAVVREQYVNLGIPAGIPAAVFDDAVDADRLYLDIKTAVDAHYAGQDVELDKASLIDGLYQKFVRYANSRQIAITGEVDQGLEHLSELCVSAYVKQADHPVLRMLGRYAGRFRATGWLIAVGLAALAAVCYWMIWRLSRLKHQAVRRWNASLLAASWMLLLAPGAVYLSRGVDKLGVTSLSLRPLMITYVDKVLTTFLITGGVMTVAVITVGMIAVHLIKKRL
ncbi:MAG: hypothetical protein ACOYJY_04050 [Acutalibacteraceae bacterium]|jgi:hypothetical protein